MQRARTSWPARDDTQAWAALANRAMQMEMLEVDQTENDAWMKTMRALVAEQLDYDTFTARRMAALSDRLRSRKLAQTNLRYKYGLKQRRGSLVRLDVKRYLRASE
ncbi:hypothetical protein E3T61_18450 [Cryobacterium lactosi]|uniref:Uncharacterized protein n=1 Tax=Cryobacterium lactosi TaxID=1259202 RepID=A0A4R9BJW8_9MICO|nr:hypothetical protein [Cryobacterium lactosi]TFD85001.1 hypothetical protein E3T61_18450 [Cryobacterium lactosi]